ncbi:MAG: AAA family ATPase [Clostridia bacterium]|nr:AAA family ATPase [Clostridia bacterium]
MKRFVIGICGPSGSGKSTIAEKLAAELGCAVISSDRFFRSELPTMISPADGKEYCLPQKEKADFVINNEYGFHEDLKKCAEDIRKRSVIK